VIDPFEAPSGLGLDPTARESDGRLTVEILDPGWTRGRLRQAGRITRHPIVADKGEPDDSWQPVEYEFHLSTARIEGPAWGHLPVDVMFRFADGTVVRELWDGRSPYRIYRFLRAAPLSEVRIDPEGKIALDPDPVNNARLREPNRRLARDWAYWIGGLAQLIGEALASWL